MAPNKFENHIKRQLEEREIRPSSDAWLKLSEKLDEHVIEKPKKRGYFWYMAAACLVGLIALSVVFFTTTNSISDSNIQVVEDENKIIEKIDDFEKIETLKNPIEVVSIESNPDEKKKNHEVKTNVQLVEKDKLAEQIVDAPKEVEVPLNDASDEIINSKVLQVLAQVDVLEQDNEALTDAEVDSLLRKAQEEILRDKLFRSDHSVDAMALLSEVEYELDKSFRDQIFESLKSGFLKVRTAVADRNN